MSGPTVLEQGGRMQIPRSKAGHKLIVKPYNIKITPLGHQLLLTLSKLSEVLLSKR